MSGGDGDIEALLGQVEAALADLNLENVSSGIVSGLRDALEGLDAFDDQLREGDGSVASPGPGLHLVEPDEGATASVDDPQVTVRVLRHVEPLGPDGRIHVRGETQTVFRGEVPRAYRVGCTSGSFHLAADGVTLDTMRPDTTIDLEARSISVTGEGRGVYTRLA